MRRNLFPSIDDHADRSEHSYRRELERLAERHRRKFYRSDIFLFVHDRGGLTRHINSCFFQNAKLFHTFKKPCHTDSCSHFHKDRVAGVHNSLLKRLRSVAGRLMASDPTVFYYFIPGTGKGVCHFYHTFVKCRSRGHYFKRRTRLIRIADCQISPHGIERCHLLLFTHPLFSIYKCIGMIQVKFRCIYHRINLTILWIHNNNFHRLCLFLF